MPKSLKRNAIIVVGLAVLFYCTFMYAKHSPALPDVIPFGDDPYDAVGSFAALIGPIIALVSLVRAFRPYRNGAPSVAQRAYLVRAQVAVVLAILITLAADAVAMARHPSMWIGAAVSNELVALLAGLATAAIAVLSLVLASERTLTQPIAEGTGSHRWPRAVLVTLLAIFVLIIYPEHPYP